MWVQQAIDAHWFADRAGPWLDRFPVESNVLATWLQAELDGRPRPGSRWWLVTDDTGALAGVAFQAKDHPLQLAPMTSDAAVALAQHYAGSGIDPMGVCGIDTSAHDFAVTWQHQTGAHYRLVTAMRMHALTRLLDPRTPGTSRLAGPQDADLCETWLTAYTSEVHPHEYRETLRPMVDRRIRNGELWFWERYGEPVALAGVTRPAAGVARVVPVYTPPVFRRQGHGAAVAATVTTAALAAGARTCMLYTDLANPVSNAVYQRLGYRPVADAVRYDFEPVLLRPQPPVVADPWRPPTPANGVPPYTGPLDVVPPPDPLDPSRAPEPAPASTEQEPEPEEQPPPDPVVPEPLAPEPARAAGPYSPQPPTVGTGSRQTPGTSRTVPQQTSR